MIELKSLSRRELEELVTRLGQPKFRAGQLFHWLHAGAESFEEMTNLPRRCARSCGNRRG